MMVPNVRHYMYPNNLPLCSIFFKSMAVQTQRPMLIILLLLKSFIEVVSVSVKTQKQLACPIEPCKESKDTIYKDLSRVQALHTAWLIRAVSSNNGMPCLPSKRWRCFPRARRQKGSQVKLTKSLGRGFCSQEHH